MLPKTEHCDNPKANNRNFKTLFLFLFPRFVVSLAEVDETNICPSTTLQLKRPRFAGGVVDIARRGASGLEGGDLLVSTCAWKFVLRCCAGFTRFFFDPAGITTNNGPPSLILISAASFPYTPSKEEYGSASCAGSIHFER
jgi:hypothetical protein